MNIFVCLTCSIEKPLTEYFKDRTNKYGIKQHCKECIQVKRTEFRKKIQIPETLQCVECKKVKHNSEYDRDNTIYIGLKRKCKQCISIIEKQRNCTWEALVRKRVIASWTAHGNTNKENRISIEEASKMLEEQNYKCVHCCNTLSNISGDQYKKNCWIASLDRIDTNIVGYGNGNAQWLCMSCNNGKNTMSNEEHLNKFKSRDDKIKELEQEVLRLRNIIHNMEKAQRLNGKGREIAEDIVYSLE
jgi:hypothetical protein